MNGFWWHSGYFLLLLFHDFDQEFCFIIFVELIQRVSTCSKNGLI